LSVSWWRLSGSWSLALSRIPTMNSRPTAARAASRISSDTCIRFSRLPPYSPVRALLFGFQN
jgi:hypothetical protein